MVFFWFCFVLYVCLFRGVSFEGCLCLKVKVREEFCRKMCLYSLEVGMPQLDLLVGQFLHGTWQQELAFL